RSADLARADDHHPPLPPQAEDLAERGGQLGYRVAQPPLAERSEEGEVLPNLSGGRASPARQLFAGNRRQPPILELLEEPQIDRQSSDGGFGDALHVLAGL